ncbi:MAG: transcription termination factor NusA [Calditrichaeota bacterium]|nr:transcription termination factor NusA [Calditrichota bacterium]MCB9366529.1 transcription termination factor NusA [Calditrichota bacterium]MCB9391213.1 transcription termination factor NusA [Calditrichota bacterium]
MNTPIVEAIGQILQDKSIDRDAFREIIEGVFHAMIKKKYGNAENFDVIFNIEKGDIEIFCEKEIVDDDDLTDSVTQMPLSRALKIDDDLDIGDTYAELVDVNEFGRRLVMTARQNLTQKIREIEKENIYQEFSSRVGEIVTGEIHQINRRELRIHLDRYEAVMPKSEQVYNEKYVRGKSIRAIIKEVRKTTKDPEVVVSRADAAFVTRLFELEVPEIFDSIIEIMGVAREAGDRTKIAVRSHDKRIDPVGACVGMKGIRIQAVVRELGGEKIDIIHWSADPEIFVKRAMSPATPLLVVYDQELQTATVVVPDDQIQFAVGKRGQNLRLASELTGVPIEPIKESEYLAPEPLQLAEVGELDEAIRNKLLEAGFELADDVLDAGEEKIMTLTKLSVEQVREIMSVLNSYFVTDEGAAKAQESGEEDDGELNAESKIEG